MARVEGQSNSGVLIIGGIAGRMDSVNSFNAGANWGRIHALSGKAVSAFTKYSANTTNLFDSETIVFKSFDEMKGRLAFLTKEEWELPMGLR